MTDKLLEQVSALADDELPAREAELLLTRLERDPALRDAWERYQLIGEAMRGSLAAVHDRDLAARLVEAIEQEPVSAKPFQPARILRPVAGLAVAASVAMLAVFTLQAPQVEPPPAEVVPEFAGSGARPVLNAQRVDFSGVRSPEVQNQLRRYLLNHSEHADNMRIRGVMPYVQIAAHDSRPVNEPDAATEDEAGESPEARRP